MGGVTQADKETCWDTITTSDIVYFKGTKILGTSPDGGTDIHILDDPSDGHGTAVTGAVLDANPDAVIFFVEGFSTGSALAAMETSRWLTSLRPLRAIGFTHRLGIETGTHQTVVVNNKIHTGAADNTPRLLSKTPRRPHWSIGIAGYAEKVTTRKKR